MRPALVVFFLCSLFSLSAAQVEYSKWSFGFSIGTGWGMDVGYGKTKVTEQGLVKGWLLVGSVWMPKFESGNPAGEEGYFDWLVATDKTVSKTGYGVGCLYLYDKFGAGVMLDYVLTLVYQNYHSPETGYDWHTPPDRSGSLGVTLNLIYKLGENFDGTIFLGTERGIMAGVVITM